MRWGIVFSIPAINEVDIYSLPQPSNLVRLSANNSKGFIRIYYHFEYPPQDLREWQRVAGIKHQIKHRVKGVVFEEYLTSEVTGKVYRISELGKFFQAFVKFPQPQFPQVRRDAYSRLYRHANRLVYENMLYVEQLIHVSMRFNAAHNNDIGIGQVVKRAKSVYLSTLDNLDNLKEKLSPNDLKKAHRTGADKTNVIKLAKKNYNTDKAQQMKANGSSINEICLKLDVSNRTVFRYLQKDNKVK